MVKIKKATVVVAFVIAGGSVFGADNVADWISGRQPSHVWKNQDGSRTYRYDSGRTTAYRHRTAKDIQVENELIASVLIPVVIGAYDIACDFYEWQQRPEVRQQAALLIDEARVRMESFFCRK